MNSGLVMMGITGSKLGGDSIHRKVLDLFLTNWGFLIT